MFEANNNDDDTFHYHAVFPLERGFKEESALFSEWSFFPLFSGIMSPSELPLLRKRS